MIQRQSAILTAYAAFGFLTVLPVSALAAPNFSGEWKMNAAKSDYGRMPAPNTFERKVTHRDPLLKIVSTQSGARGTSTAELNLTTDGQNCVNKVHDIEVTSVAHWEGDNLLISSTENFHGADIHQIEKWTLSQDGKTLTIGTRVSAPQGQYNILAVFDKQ
ncbi:MAG: hypothetical protein ACRD9L_09535 [Bryobacteraceae bacterium]